MPTHGLPEWLATQPKPIRLGVLRPTDPAIVLERAAKVLGIPTRPLETVEP